MIDRAMTSSNLLEIHLGSRCISVRLPIHREYSSSILNQQYNTHPPTRAHIHTHIGTNFHLFTHKYPGYPISLSACEFRSQIFTSWILSRINLSFGSFSLLTYKSRQLTKKSPADLEMEYPPIPTQQQLVTEYQGEIGVTFTAGLFQQSSTIVYDISKTLASCCSATRGSTIPC